MGGAQVAPPSGANEPASAAPSSNRNDDGGRSLEGERQPRGKSGGNETTSLSGAAAAAAVIPEASNNSSNRSGSWRDGKERLLDRLFAWKSGEAWREVVLMCGASAAEGAGGRGGGLGSACEMEVRVKGERVQPNHPLLYAGPRFGCVMISFG